jgi:hypothetical protein
VSTTGKTAIELLVVDNDFGGDPDGLVALAHILLRRHSASPVLVTSSPLDPDLSEAAGLAPTATASRGGKLAEQLIRLLKLSDVPIPLEEYSRMTIPADEVKSVLALTSSVGSWLAGRLLDVPPFVQLGATLTLGDSVLVPFTPHTSAQTPPTLPGGVVHNEIESNQLWDNLITRLAELA